MLNAPLSSALSCLLCLPAAHWASFIKLWFESSQSESKGEAKLKVRIQNNELRDAKMQSWMWVHYNEWFILLYAQSL